MDKEPQKPHVVFFPFMAHGHMIPTLDIARLFSARGVRVTIITTTLNAPFFTKNINQSNNTAATMHLEIFKLPLQEVGLPEGFETLEQAVKVGAVNELLRAGDLLRDQLEQFLEKTLPSCLVADMFFMWAPDSAIKFNIPTLLFHGISNIALCAGEILRLYQPYKNVSSEKEPFILPSLPHEIKMTGLQIIEDMRKGKETEFLKRMNSIRECELKCYGVIMNSFYELEPDYADFFRKELGRRTWNVGPLLLYSRGKNDYAPIREDDYVNNYECLNWLNSKQPNSIIYICFGSTLNLIPLQMQEVAVALEASGHGFIWVIREDEGGKSKRKLPPEFEQRTKSKGLIIRGWAPQRLILEHEAIGGFVTHCGWNSTLEAISAGVPMVTWPHFADQFYNEILVTGILKIGVAIEGTKWSLMPSAEDVIKSDVIEKAVREILVGEGAEERRMRAKKLKEMAWKAVEEGGSSSSSITALIEELSLSSLKRATQD